LVKIGELELLNKAEMEEKIYNWEEAAVLYEQVAKAYLDKNMLIDAAIELLTNLGRYVFDVSEHQKLKQIM